MSRTLIDPAKASEQDRVSQYTAGDALYATVYLTQTVKTKMPNVKGRLANYTVSFEENGKMVVSGASYLVPGSDMGDSYFQLSLFATDDDPLSNSTLVSRIELHQRLLKLAPRNYDFMVHFGDGDFSSRFSTSLKMDMASAKPVLEKQLANPRELKIDYASLPKAALSNTAFEQVLMQGPGEFKLGKPLRTVLVDKGWTVYKTALGVPMHKYIRGYVAYEKDGRCFYNNINVNRIYTGGGNYGEAHPVMGGRSTGDGEEMRCNNVNK